MTALCGSLIPGLNGRLSLRSYPTILLLISFVLISGCAPTLLEPPRLATATVASSSPGLNETRTPQFLAAPSPTPGTQSVAGTGDVAADVPTREITLWIDDTSAAASTAAREISDAFTAASSIGVDLVVVRAEQLPQLMETAVISNTLPDLVLHPLAYTIGWTERGILNPRAATSVVEQLDSNTFRPGALELVAVGANDDTQVAAIPSEAW
ncbi:MAG: hypothetical protein R3300_09785, partial [Candidatus Promineifilaceae bacterium]|nr:hypothetical protein [Candidatus Promineifilaceae bacterium]